MESADDNITLFNSDDTEGPPTMFKLEFSEVGSSIPFKVIKLEQPGGGEPNLINMEIADPSNCLPPEAIPDHSKADQSKLSKRPHSPPTPQAPPGQPKAAEQQPRLAPKKKQRRMDNDVEDMSSDDDSYSSESDMESRNNSESDSECEDLSDGDDLAGSHDDAGPKQVRYLQLFEDPPPSAWSPDPSTMKQIEFTKKQELLIPPAQSPYEAFCWFLTDELLDTIVEETNKYAQYFLSQPTLPPNSRYKAWRDVTRDEMRTFVALLIHTGTIRTNRIGDFWKGHYLFNLTCFSQFMTRNRFMLILNSFTISFQDPNNARERDAFERIRPVVDSFNKKMNEIYYPGKELYIAKSMVFWRGQLIRQEYTDSRRHRKGIYVFTLAEPNGPVIKYNVYTEKTNYNINKITTGEIAMDLVREKLGNGHSVYTDKYYSSYPLARTLLDNNTYCTGTLDKRRLNLPFKRKAEQYRSTSLFYDGVHVGKWKDKHKMTLFISTELDGKMQSVIEKNGKMGMRPKALVNYSKYMTIAEFQDLLMLYHPCSRKSMRWYKKLFVHSLQIYMVTAHYLYNNYCDKKKRLSYYDFRLRVLGSILPEPYVPPPRTITTFHALTKITKTKTRQRKDKDGNVKIISKVMRKECKLCRANKKRIVTQFECSACDGSPGFCTKCFCDFHSSNSVEARQTTVPAD